MRKGWTNCPNSAASGRDPGSAATAAASARLGRGRRVELGVAPGAYEVRLEVQKRSLLAKTDLTAGGTVALGGAVVVAYAGASGLWLEGSSVRMLLSCLGFALCVQVACNFANDLGDSLRGADTAARVGPRRAVSAGDISPSAMRRGIWIACLLALFLGAPVALLSPWLLFAGLLAIACAPPEMPNGTCNGISRGVTVHARINVGEVMKRKSLANLPVMQERARRDPVHGFKRA